MLLQYENNGDSRLTAFVSTNFSDVEKRYSQTETKSLTMVCRIKRVYYLIEIEFDLVTDHKPLDVIFKTHIQASYAECLHVLKGWY